jgi:thymidylate synthase (FAD)
LSINTIKQPRVTLLSRPTFLEPEHLKITWAPDIQDAEKLVEFAGRLCYMSQNNPSKKSTKDYIDNIKQQAHGSVLEHAVFVLLIEGISRTCTHELVRHRAGFGYSQLSQRYVDESHADFVMPPVIIGNEILEKEWTSQMAIAQQAYISMVNGLYEKYGYGRATTPEERTHLRKKAREAARSVLPNATETKIVVSGNVRAWRTMLELRTSEGAEAEIRRLGIKCLKILQKEAANVFSDFEIYEYENSEAARVKYHKI